MRDSFLGQALATALSAVLAATAAAVARSLPSEPRPGEAAHSHPVAGRDVSWPNCPKGMGMPSRRTLGNPMPPPTSTFVVIGLTNGPAFHPNPCLQAQVDYAKAHHLWTAAYAVVTYPTRGQLRRHGATGPEPVVALAGRLWNTGWAQARRNVSVMRGAGLDSPIIWVDVEPVSPPAPWARNRRANRTVLQGALAYYRATGFDVGFYSTPSMWREIVGPVRYGLPEWRTAGLSTRRAAIAKCDRDPFQGGRAVIVQWYSTREDFDLLCPGRPAEQVLRDYFTPY
jgi:hypothetical protein